MSSKEKVAFFMLLSLSFYLLDVVNDLVVGPNGSWKKVSVKHDQLFSCCWYKRDMPMILSSSLHVMDSMFAIVKYDNIWLQL